MRRTVTMTKAVDIAIELDDVDFADAVDQARKLGLQSIEIVTRNMDGQKTDIYLQRPDSIMIAWKPSSWERAKIAIPNGEQEDDIHLTILYLGAASDFDTDQQRTIIGVVSQVAQGFQPIRGTVNGFGRFLTPDDEGRNALWLGGDYPGLNDLRDALVAGLTDAGITWEDTYPSYIPHITIAYIDQDADTPQVSVSPFDLVVDNLTVYIGGLEYELDLDAMDSDDYYDGPVNDASDRPNLYYPAILSKSGAVLDDEKQYSYGAWYVPDSLDAHGEWAGRDTVQESLWKYVQSGNRDIHIQHEPALVAGEWVELATIPFPISVPVETSPGILQKHTYPAGTPFMGVKWQDWAWPLVKDGSLRGFSVGGTADRIEADFPAELVQKARDAKK